MKKWNIVLLVLIASSTIIVRLLFPSVYHEWDLTTIGDMGHYAEHFKDIYNSGNPIPYPIFGLTFSIGVLKAFNYHHFPYLIFSALIETMNILLFYALVKRNDSSKALLFTFIYTIIPATWAGGYLWAQIDHVGTTVLFFLLLVFHNIFLTRHFSKLKAGLLGGLILVGVLIKQPLIFSLIVLSISFLRISFQYPLRQNLSFIASGIFTAAFLFFMLEYWINYQDGWTHLQEILEISNHADRISANGFNIWQLAGLEPRSSSRIDLGGGFSPFGIGLALFLLWLFYLTVDFCKSSVSFENMLKYLALVNLSFNLFLTGTHERYLYYFYPILLLWAIIKKDKSTIYVTILCGTCYGWFVWGILVDNPIALNSHSFISIVHLSLFAYLIIKPSIKKRTKLPKIRT